MFPYYAAPPSSPKTLQNSRGIKWEHWPDMMAGNEHNNNNRSA